MLELILQFLLETLTYILFTYPGGILLWLLQGRKTALNATIDENHWKSVLLGLLFWLFIALMIFFSS